MKDDATENDITESIEGTIRQEAEAYRGDSDQPLAGYAMIAVSYTTMVAAGVLLARRFRTRDAAASVGPWDLALMGLTTHKLSRMLAKDPVTSPLRAFFTRFQGVSGPSELEEDVRGEGGRKAIGELITCPFCTSQWVATGYAFGLVFAPTLTRSAGAVFSAVAVSDWLQPAYARLQQVQE